MWGISLKEMKPPLWLPGKQCGNCDKIAPQVGGMNKRRSVLTDVTRSDTQKKDRDRLCRPNDK